MIEKRDHETIRTTHRAGILEHGSVSMLVDSGASDRVLTAGHNHEGIDLRFGGQSHRLDFTDLVGEAVWLYPQNEVFVDLAAARERDGGQIHWAVSDTEVRDLTTNRPKITSGSACEREPRISPSSSEHWDGWRPMQRGGLTRGPSCLIRTLFPRGGRTRLWTRLGTRRHADRVLENATTRLARTGPQT